MRLFEILSIDRVKRLHSVAASMERKTRRRAYRRSMNSEMARARVELDKRVQAADTKRIVRVATKRRSRVAP